MLGSWLTKSSSATFGVKPSLGTRPNRTRLLIYAGYTEAPIIADSQTIKFPLPWSILQALGKDEMSGAGNSLCL